MLTSFDPDQLTGFFVGDTARVRRKLDQLARTGAGGAYYLFDFDRTLTTSKHTGEDITTWYILHGVLPEIGQQQRIELLHKYQPLELAGQLGEADALDWWNSALNLYVQHPVNIKDIEAAAKHVQLRDGTTKLFKDCEKAGIPTVILSAGVSDVIDIIVGARGIHPTLVLSTKLVLAEDGHILGWDRGSMIHILNKREQGNTELCRLRKNHPFTILVGDSLQDADMIDGDDQVLRIRICDRPPADESARQTYLRQSYDAGFDMVLEEDMLPLVQLNKWLFTQSEAQKNSRV